MAHVLPAKIKSEWKLETFKIVSGVLIAALTGMGSASWKAGDMLSGHEGRINENEKKLVEIRAQIVPRTEHEQKWKALDERFDSEKRSIDALDRDIREVRKQNDTILLNIKSIREAQ